MATVSLTVTKAASGSGNVYTVTSGDATANSWIVVSNAFDNVDDFSGIQEPLWQEILRQLKQI